MRKKNANAVKLMGMAIGAALLPCTAADACMYHWLRGIPEPNGVWPTLATPSDASAAIAQLQQQDALDDAAVNNASLNSASLGGASISGSVATVSPMAQPAAEPAVQPASVPTSPAITAWLVNTTNTDAYSTNTAIEADVAGLLANVGTDAYTSTEVYVYATGLPSYNLGPFGNDPNAPTNQKRTFEIPLTPTPAPTGTNQATGLGPIGMAVNGVAIFNPWDGNYYNASHGTSMVAGYWQQNANMFEASSFDIGPGHPAPGGTYHYHEEPTTLISQVDPGNTGQHASPVIGFAADGYPIFGPYGYVVNSQGQVIDGSNGQPEVELVTSSYEENNYGSSGVRPNGGPNTSVEPDGSYLQDFTYVSGYGTLDQYNGRFAVAPGYPNGTYGYYVTGTYPYIIGPDFYGTVDSKDLAMGGTIMVPNTVTYYTPTVPEPSSCLLLATGGSMLLLRRRSVFRSR